MHALLHHHHFVASSQFRADGCHHKTCSPGSIVALSVVVVVVEKIHIWRERKLKKKKEDGAFFVGCF